MLLIALAHKGMIQRLPRVVAVGMVPPVVMREPVARVVEEVDPRVAVLPPAVEVVVRGT